MASKKTTFTIAGNLIVEAQANFKNIENAVAGLGQKLQGLTFNDKTTRSLEVTLGRIAGLLPSLKSKAGQGVFNDRELKEYNAEMQLLTREIDGLSRQFRGIDGRKIDFDSAELKEYQKTIANLKVELKSMSKAPQLNVAGLTGTKGEIEGWQRGLAAAAKSGESLVGYVANLASNLKNAANEQEKWAASAQTTEENAKSELDQVRQKLALYTRIQEALESQQKTGGPQGPALNQDLKQAREQDESFRGLTTSQQKLEAVKIQIAQATETQNQAEEKHAIAVKESEVQTTRYLQAAEKVRNIELFSSANLGQLQAFDAKFAELASKLQLTEQEAEDLREALLKAAQVTLENTSREFTQLGTATKNYKENVEDLANAEKKEAAQTEQAKDAFKNKITQMFGLYNVYQLVRRAIRSAYQDIKELDSAMNEIAVVTNMTTDQLWQQIDTYMAMAQQYGVATKGVYEVSKLYYQQGRATAEVTLLTGETLKMAKIAGLDYSKATDNMTVALNGFKLQASDASMIVDVYSQLAARSAMDTEELAYAMSKTASIAESAGMSFKNTSVFLTQMIETTREAPENIGTAMKTIIARFQEMKKSPLELVNVEGEEISFNRVDKALQSIGMTLQDAHGQFKNLDDVIYELAGKWDTLDRNTQRYIATIVAGSRQQSRFLALMANSDRLQELKDEAEGSEDAGLVQYAKTLDSLESKLNQLKTSFQEFYMSIINGPLVKFFVDAIRWIVDAFKTLPPTVSIILGPALIKIMATLLKKIGTSVIGSFRTTNATILAEVKKLSANIKREITNAYKPDMAEVQAQTTQAARAPGTPVRPGGRLDARSLTTVPSAQGLGTKILGGVTSFLGYAAIAASAISAVVAVLDWAIEDEEERIERLTKNVEDTKIKAATDKAQLKDLSSLQQKHKELSHATSKTNEQYDEWVAVNSEILDQYPQLLAGLDEEGNRIADLAIGYENLFDTMKSEALDSQIEASIQRIKVLEDESAYLQDKGMASARIFSAPVQEEGSSLSITQSTQDLLSRALFDIYKAGGLGSLSGILDSTSPVQGVISEAETFADNYAPSLYSLFQPYQSLARELKGIPKDQWEAQGDWLKEASKFYDGLEATRGKGISTNIRQTTFDTLSLMGLENEEIPTTGPKANYIQRMVGDEYTTEALTWDKLGEKERETQISNFLNNIVPEMITKLVEENDFLKLPEKSDAYKTLVELEASGGSMSTGKMKQKIAELEESEDGKTALLGLEEITTESGKTYAILEQNATKTRDAVLDYNEKIAELNEKLIEDGEFLENEKISDFDADLEETLSPDAIRLLADKTEELIKIFYSDSRLSVRKDERGKGLSVEGARENLDMLFSNIEKSDIEIPKEFLDAFDPQTLTGSVDIIQKLKGLQAVAEDKDKEAYNQLIQDFEQYYKAQQFTYSEQEIQSIMGQWLEKQQKLLEERDKIFSFAERGKMVSEDGYSWDEDFTEAGTLTEKGWEKYKAAALQNIEPYWDLLTDQSKTKAEGVLDRIEQKALQQKRKDLFTALLSGIDFSEEKISISSDTYDKLNEQLGDGVQELFTQTLEGYEIADGEFEQGAEAIMKQASQVPGAATQLAEALQTAQQSIVESIIQSPEELVKSTKNLGGFADEMTARAIAIQSGNENQAIVESKETGLWGIDGVEAFAQLSQVLQNAGKNAYSFINYLDESYSGMEGLGRVSEQLAEAQEELGEQTEDAGEQQKEQSAKIQQYAKKQAEMIFDSATYGFMSNSPTNEKLAPMYTLFENISQQQQVLAESSANGGKIQLKDFHAMRDYVKHSQNVDKETLNLLDSVEANFDPTLETSLDEQTIDAFGNAIEIKAREDVDRYNEAVEANNELVNALKEGKAGNLKEDVSFGGETYKKGVEGEATRLAEMAYATLSVKDSLAVNALANYLRDEDGTLSSADAFAQALSAYGHDSPELQELQTIQRILESIAAYYGLDTNAVTEQEKQQAQAQQEAQDQAQAQKQTQDQAQAQQKAQDQVQAAESQKKQNELWQKRIDQLTTEKEGQQDEITSLQSKTDSLNKQIAELDLQIATLKETNAVLEDSKNLEIQQLTTKKDNLQLQLDASFIEQERLERTQEQNSNEIASLQDQLQSLQNSIANKDQIEEELNNELTIKQNQITALTEQITELDLQVTALKEANTALENSKNSEIEQLTTKKDNLQLELDARSIEQQDLKKIQEQNSNEIASLQDRLQQLQDSIAIEEQTIFMQNSELFIKQEEITALNDQIAELDTQIATLKEANTALENSKNSEIEQLTTQKDNLQLQLDSSSAEQQHLKEVQEQNSNEIASLQNQLQQSQDSATAKEAETVALKEEINLLQEKLTDQEATKTDSEAKLAAANEELATATSTKAEVDLRIKELETQLQESNSQITDLTTQISELKSQLVIAEQQVTKAQEEALNQTNKDTFVEKSGTKNTYEDPEVYLSDLLPLPSAPPTPTQTTKVPISFWDGLKNLFKGLLGLPQDDLVSNRLVPKDLQLEEPTKENFEVSITFSEEQINQELDKLSTRLSEETGSTALYYRQVSDLLSDEEKQIILNTDDAEERFTLFRTLIEEEELDLVGVNLPLTTQEEKWAAFRDKINNTTLTPKVELQYTETPIGQAATGTENAKGGKTLVGELGPEIRVSGNRFQVIGKDGPEIVKLKKGDMVLNHLQTSQILRNKNLSGQAFVTGTPTPRYDPFDPVLLEAIKWLANQDQKQPAKTGNTSPKDDKSNTAEFDRWYNYLQVLADIERAINEIQAARENLFGRDYVESLTKEMSLIENQQKVTTMFLKDQETYMGNLQKSINSNKDFNGLIEVIDGVMQIDWNKLNGMEKGQAEPIQKAIADWEAMADAISESKQALSGYQAQLREYQDEIRQGYVEAEKQVIDALKYRQQMVIDNLQAELDMKTKYDNKYLDALRKNIDAERKMRERSDQEEDRVKLQRKLAMLKRDTSGKSALAISQAEEELRSMNRSAYDQRQDDFVQQEEDALLAAQEAIRDEVELQTAVLDIMNDNVQVIQDKIDALMNSGPENLAQFLIDWNADYLNSTPTAQIEMKRSIEDVAGKAQGYIDIGKEKFDIPLSELKQNWLDDTKINTDPDSTGDQNSPTTTSPPAAKPQAKKRYDAVWTSPYTGEKISAYSMTSQQHADSLLEPKKKAHIEKQMQLLRKASRTSTSASDTAGPGSQVALPYSSGGLVDYTGPAIVHGSKQKPEAVLNPQQTGIFQHFVDLMDQNFGKNIQSSMVKPKSFEGTPEQTTVIVEKIILESGVIARDYDARRAGDLIEEKILNIAKYKGNMSLKR